MFGVAAKVMGTWVGAVSGNNVDNPIMQNISLIALCLNPAFEF
jgi:hypothetical protein